MIHFLLNLPTPVYVVAMVILIGMILSSYIFQLGETKYKGKMEGGAGISIKAQNIPRWRAWKEGSTWAPNRRVPGMGNLPGHAVDDVWNAWYTGFAFGAIIVVIAAIVYFIWG